MLYRCSVLAIQYWDYGGGVAQLV